MRRSPAIPPRREPIGQRLQRFTVVDAVTGCWNWVGAVDAATGYGRIKVGSTYEGGARTLGAHRVSYEFHKGPIPTGLEPDHLCRNRRCVNPDHMEAVTRRENTLRSNNPAAINARKTHCVRGHELAGDNLGTSKTGERVCRLCARAKTARWRNRAREDALREVSP